MKTTQIKPRLSETVVADVMQAIQSNSARLAATYHDDLYSTLEHLGEAGLADDGLKVLRHQPFGERAIGGGAL